MAAVHSVEILWVGDGLDPENRSSTSEATYSTHSMIVGLYFESTANAEVQMMVITEHTVAVER